MPHRGPGRGASFGVIEEPSRADRSPDRLMLVLIATDLDGTLLTGDKQLSSRTRRMLAAAARAGVPVVPVTARQIYGLSGWRDVLTSWALCSNGAICWNLADETILFRQLMDAQMCQRFTQDLLKVAPGTVFATIRDDGEEFVSQTGYAELADVADHNRDPRTMPSLPLEDVVAQHRSMDDDPITSLRVVRGRTSDYQRLGRLQKLVDQICNGEVDLEDARSHLETLVAAPRLYRPWFVTLNMGLMGGGISWLFSGSIWDVLLAFFTTCLVDMAVQAMGRRHVTSFFTQAVGGAVPTVMALLVMILQWKANMSLPLSPSLVVAAGMISLLAGTSMVSAAQDAIDGYVVTSSGRFVDVFVQTGGIILGVMGVLWIGLKVGTPSYINPTVWVSGPIITQMLAAAIVSWSFGVSCHAGLRVLVTCAFLGAIGWGGYVLGAALGMSAPAASGVGAFLVGMAATAASRRWDFPQVGLVTCGVVTLMPGMMIYRGLYMILGSQLDQPSAAGGGTVLMQALLVGIAIAIGSSLGALTVRPLIVPLDHASRLATFRSWGMGATVPRERTSSRGIRKRWRSLKERKAAGTS